MRITNAIFFSFLNFGDKKKIEFDIKIDALVSANEIWLSIFSFQRQSGKQWLTFTKCFVLMLAMVQRSHLTKSKVWRVVDRLEKGGGKAEVAEPRVFLTIWFTECGSIFLEMQSRRPRQAHSHVTKLNEDRYSTLTARRYQDMNASLFQQHLRSSTSNRCIALNWPKLALDYRSVCS